MPGPLPVCRTSLLVIACGAALLSTASAPAQETKTADAPAGESAPEPPSTDKSDTAPSKVARNEEMAPANPLGRVIRGFFRDVEKNKAERIIPKTEPRKAIPDLASPSIRDRSTRDKIDARAPYDPEHAKLLRAADAFIEAGDWKEATIVLQRLLDRPDDSLIRRPPGGTRPDSGAGRVGHVLGVGAHGDWVSVHREANHLLGELPPEALNEYRLQYGVIARRMLAEARESDRAERFVAVAVRFFHTEAGHEAANHLAALHFDRGEFAVAARWFQQLIEAGAPVTNDPRWQIKAAFALRRAGSESQAEEVAAQVRSTADDGRITLGGRQIDPHKWIELMHRDGGVPPRPLAEWPLLLGSPSRTGTAVGGDPLLLPRWSHPSTFSRQIEERIALLVQDLWDARRATVPATVPIMVDGKVIFRTLRGVQVVDAVTGDPLWETREGLSPERLLSGRTGRSSHAHDGTMLVQGAMQLRSGSLGESNPLANLLFRHGPWGVLGSDGEQLFVIEDLALLSDRQPGYRWERGGERNDPHRRDWTTNKIVSYDLQTGRPAWEIGGPQRNEAFELPLAGHFFFGNPVADRDELFVVGEKESEVRLFCLDRLSGAPKWSQLIALSDTKIEQDVGRRWLTSQVAVGDGVLVCPTTVGWLVAVDRVSRSVLWAHRYAPVQENKRPRWSRENTSLVEASSLNQRWHPSAPVIAGDRVIYTPGEYVTLPDQHRGREGDHAAIVCLSLSDGRRLWEQPKGNFLYLAGVFGDRVVLVGTTSVTALSLDYGVTLWSVPLPQNEVRPSGMGVAVGERYHLPLHSGQLWTIDLAQGKVVSKSYLREESRPLGNLGMYRGLLVSLSPFGATSFEQRDAIVAEIRRRKEKDPHDTWALLREADIAILGRQHEAALESLRKIHPKKVPEELSGRYREAMIETLTAVIRSDLRGRDGEMDELAAFVRSAGEKLTFRRLRGQWLEARGEHRQAFELYWELASEPGEPMIARGDVGRDSVAAPPPRSGGLQRGDLTVRFDRWVAGNLRDAWSRMPGEVRMQLDERIAEAAEKALAGDTAARERFCLLFGFHRSSLPVRDKLVEERVAAADLAGTEGLLAELASHEDPAVAARALERLARLWQSAGLERDAAHYYRLLEEKYGDVKLDDGRTVRELVASLREAGAIGGGERKPPSWGDSNMQVVHSGTDFESSADADIETAASRLPFFRNRRFQLLQRHNKLAVIDSDDESLDWLVPLRGDRSYSDGVFVPTRISGHRMIVLHDGVVHCLSPAEKKVLWTRPLDPNLGAGTHYRRSERVRSMDEGQRFASENQLLRQGPQDGMLVAAGSQYVCLHGRRRIAVLDAATGDVLWTRGDLPHETQVCGTEDVIYLASPSNDRPVVALRALDGKPLEIPRLAEVIPKAVYSTGNSLVLIEAESSSFFGFSRTKTTVRMTDPLSGRQQWKVQFPNNTLFSLLDDGYLVTLARDGKLDLLDLETGRTVLSAKVGEEEMKFKSEFFVLADRDTLVVVGNRSGRRYYYYSGGLHTFRAHGVILAFDRETGRQLWKQDAADQNLIANQFQFSPVLTFMTRRYIRDGNRISYSVMSLLAIDKRTGRKLLETEMPTNDYYRSFNVNLAERYVELRSYNHRVRLVASDTK